MDPYREYQDYVMAQRLRVALGLSREVLSLGQYARLRLRVREDPSEGLLERLNWGFWTNPQRLKAFLERHHQAPYLASPSAFEALLFPEERARLDFPGQAGAYYLGFLRLPWLVMDPRAFEEALREQEERGQSLPLFLNAFHLVQ
ncbi:hypothetical protein [Thermus filiformis]|uniref:Uncharacterized protein n=1 Tax=Thermus filiformis TaxID=276 RepID=A0A0A2WW60_THEFI|nr:hypothetical protein [Thermus filiformis]KGQ23027.2 hypothetical protein THFILI_06045 [Thermus filiformis]